MVTRLLSKFHKTRVYIFRLALGRGIGKLSKCFLRGILAKNRIEHPGINRDKITALIKVFFSLEFDRVAKNFPVS